mmetsp:Transcript_5063/g.8486  ORF Transcript_5063/g.8486 Transcript_5063/m.8486 type:complete len:190 (+) Transcript_5063:148-717(+)
MAAMTSLAQAMLKPTFDNGEVPDTYDDDAGFEDDGPYEHGEQQGEGRDDGSDAGAVAGGRGSDEQEGEHALAEHGAGAETEADTEADADADADSPAPPTVPPPAPPSAQPQAAAAPPRADATAAGGTSASPLVLALLVFLVLLGVRGYLSDLAAGKREAAMQAEIALLRTAVEDIRTLVATGQCGVGRG